MKRSWILSIFVIGFLSFGAGVYLLVEDSNAHLSGQVRGASDTREPMQLEIQAWNQITDEPVADLQVIVSESVVPSGQAPFAQTLTTNKQGKGIFSLPPGQYIVHPLDRDRFIGQNTVDFQTPSTLELPLIDRQSN